MRRPSRIAIPLLAALALAQAGACAPINLDPGGPDKALIRYRVIAEAQARYAQAEAACAPGADPEACRRRDQLLEDLRKRGYCRRPADPTAADPAARYALWIGCRGRA